MPKVSVIVPVYNTAKYLHRCLSSVLEQSLTDIEIITVIDASPDNSLSIVQRFQQHDERIKIFENPENKGIAASRNVGVNHASGEYIIHLDSDDFWLNRNMLHELYRRAQLDSCEILRFNGYHYEDGVPTSVIFNNLELTNGNFHQNRELWSYHAVFLFFIKKSFIDEHNLSFLEGLDIGEDGVFLSATLLAAKTISVTPRCYLAYRINQSSVTNSVWNLDKFIEEEDSSQVIGHTIQASKDALNAYLYSRIEYYWPNRIAGRALSQLRREERITLYEHARTNFSRLNLADLELHAQAESARRRSNIKKLHRHLIACEFEQVDKLIHDLNKSRLSVLVKKKMLKFFQKLLPPKRLKYKAIIIVTYGRSGSTLLQGIVNSIEGVLVRGENMDFCRGLYEAWRSLILSTDMHANDKNVQYPTSPWYGADQLNSDEFIHQCKNIIRNQLMPQKTSNVICYGFKEIRYLHHLDDLHYYLDFLQQVVPDCAIIFNMRSHDDVYASMLSTFRKDLAEQDDPAKQQAVLDNLRRADDIFRDYSRSNPNCYINHYENLIQGPDKLKPLFDFLGAKLNKKKINNTLRKIHSYDIRPNVN